MSVSVATEREGLTPRERELGAIITAYNEVTERLKTAHERLMDEVARLREELHRKNEELRRRERLAALGEMAAGLAHEIRNPLGGIALYASMLTNEPEARPQARNAAERISRAVRSLERLVSDILEFAQEHRLERQNGLLGPILSAVEDATRPYVENGGIHLLVEPSARAVSFYGDPLRLQQVLVNLVMNGVQAVERGGHVWLSAAPDRDGGTRIEVWDDGPGIPIDKLERIFNPFFTTKATGTGLGLAIVHRLVEAHEGTIRALNRAEGGARFVIHLPSAGVAERRSV